MKEGRKKIWTPGSTDTPADERAKEKSRNEKEQEVIKILLDNVKVDIPNILIEEEVNARLARLLERIEKLGLTLESYLASASKDAKQLRKEYEDQARSALSIDLILSEVSRREELKVEKAQIDAAVKAGSTDPKMAEKINTPEQRRIIESVLLRRAALDSLINLL